MIFKNFRRVIVPHRTYSSHVKKRKKKREKEKIQQQQNKTQRPSASVKLSSVSPEHGLRADVSGASFSASVEYSVYLFSELSLSLLQNDHFKGESKKYSFYWVTTN